ncbi:hypothetical protein NNC19_17280 [Clostridium sp. SHJSY1]|uniref:hypothetical protein n=1 Tax=Clostridium sp. SHJSY1 TaxID=2942483 RepID=UPI0028756E27|nr:hypothetical protein [Clostridium sp. SHJSY1]MDS0527445.1 hypothetical protein [Clostridium sp. SHJSY1]
MTKKKSRFLTFICSLLPGAGHMYIGFMKTGVSFMAAFFFIIFLSSFLKINELIYIVPLIWFYSFFDCNNKANLNDEDRLVTEDKYLFSLEKLPKIDNKMSGKSGVTIGIILLLLGVYLVFNNIIEVLRPYMDWGFYSILRNLFRQVPQVIVGVVIVVIGIKLIQGKNKERKANV